MDVKFVLFREVHKSRGTYTTLNNALQSVILMSWVMRVMLYLFCEFRTLSFLSHQVFEILTHPSSIVPVSWSHHAITQFAKVDEVQKICCFWLGHSDHVSSESCRFGTLNFCQICASTHCKKRFVEKKQSKDNPGGSTRQGTTSFNWLMQQHKLPVMAIFSQTLLFHVKIQIEGVWHCYYHLK